MIKIGLRRQPGVVGKNHLGYKDDGGIKGAEDTALSLAMMATQPEMGSEFQTQAVPQGRLVFSWLTCFSLT